MADVFRLTNGGIVLQSSGQAVLPGASAVKNPPALQETWVWLLGQKDPLEKKGQPTPVLLPGESHEQWSLAGCSPWVSKRVTKQRNTSWLEARDVMKHLPMHRNPIPQSKELGGLNCE